MRNYEIKSYDTPVSGATYRKDHGRSVRNTATRKVYEVFINGEYVNSFNLLRDAKRFVSVSLKPTNERGSK